MIVILVLVIATIALDPPDILFSVFFGYAFSGPIVTLWQKRKMRRERKIKHIKS